MTLNGSRLGFNSSMSQQLVIATVLAVLPLVLAVGYATWSLGQQTRLQHELVQAMASLNRLDASVSEQVKDLERSARQFRLLREPRFQELYMQRLAQLQRNQQRLRELPTRDSEQQTLAALVELMNEVGAELDVETPPGGAEQQSLIPSFQQAYLLSSQLSKEIDSHLQMALAEGERKFDAIVWRLSIIGVLAIPGTVLLVVISCITIYRPIRRLSEAIRQLGHRQWDRPIAIGGPTDLIELGERLEWMRQQLLATEQQKHAFLRHITHELNSPLSAVMEAGALLADKVPGDLTDAQLRVLQILQRNAQSLRELIQQLLNYNSVTHGNPRDAECIDLKQICVRLTERFDDLAEENNIVWRLQGDGDTVVADPLALEMILSNLFSNAFNFSPPDSQIPVEWGTDRSRWWLAVSDQGPGIEPEDLEEIFQPFYQGRNKRRGPLKGTGIGLAIVRECVKTMGGDIQVQSKPGKGSRFYLEFPILEEGVS